MPKELHPYELKALRQLAAYKHILTPDFVPPTRHANRQSVLEESITTFTEIFCQENFANTDYSILQARQYKTSTLQDWIDDLNIDLILQCLTYVIWTNKSMNGYFMQKVEDRFMEKILHRLDLLLAENTSKESVYAVQVARQ